jgi:hypothetical protein
MPTVNCNRYALPLGGLLAAGCASLGLSQATAASPPPAVSLAATPKLYVATGNRPAPNTPVAWAVFQTVQHVNPRLIVVRVHDRSGRSYRVAGNNCVRSTIVSDDGRTDRRTGRRYTLEFYARSGIGAHAERKLVATRKLVARAFPVPERRRAPDC